LGSAERPPPSMGKTGWGIDEPRSILQLAVSGILAVTVGFLVSIYAEPVNPDLARLALLVGPAVGFLILVVAAALFWSGRQGKISEMEKITADIPWGGDEVVLDLGCGRGLGMVLASKKLASGYSVGVDQWKKGHVSGNDPRSIWANARKEGVEGRVFAVKADLSHLPLVDSSVDVVLSVTSMHRLVKRKERRGAFDELVRVLKDGGRVGIIDAGSGGDYARHLRDEGMSDVSVRRLRFSSFPPFHVVLARKPYAM
jgi:arsenite methyltransferase